MQPRRLIVSLALFAAALGALWWLTDRSERPVVTTPEEPSALENLSPRPRSRPAAPSPTVARPQSTTSPIPPDEPAPLWERQIDQVLRASNDEGATARILISMLPNLPEEGQIEASHHISNLLDDRDYRHLLPSLLNPRMPEEVLSVLFTDLMNRGDAVKLRAFVDVAKIPEHPFREEALSDLQIYLDHDYGTDFTKWAAAVERYLRDHPQEETRP
jgi:hypothetical protein